MSKRRTKFSASTIPPIGAVYAIPVDPDLYGAARVLAVRSPNDSQLSPHEREWMAFVAVTKYAGRGKPDPSDPGLRALALDAHGTLHGVWLGTPPPSDYPLVAILPVGVEELKQVTRSVSSWLWLVGTIRRELLARRTPVSGRRDEVVSSNTPPGSVIGLQQLRESLATAFEDWEGYRSPAVVNSVKSLVSDTIERLAAFEPNSSDQQKLSALRGLVSELNRMNVAAPFIDTLEREDLMNLFERLARSSNLDAGAASAVVNEARDW